MEQVLFDVYFGDKCVCKECEIYDATAIIETLAEKYFEQVKYEPLSIRYHGTINLEDDN